MAQSSSLSQLDHHVISCRNIGALDVYVQARTPIILSSIVIPCSIICSIIKYNRALPDSAAALTGFLLAMCALMDSCELWYCDVVVSSNILVLLYLGVLWPDKVQLVRDTELHWPVAY